MHHGQHDGNNRLCGSGGDGDFICSTVASPVQPLYFVGHRLAQAQHAGHGRVLVMTLMHSMTHGVQQSRIAGKVWEALA